ncbi:N-acetyltransferase 9-like protein isoform X2 [Crassostrea angulata]|uniref:N-acetyltransferase 9-like protein isoform X2 n=1 Tax=Magallana angulata TaxID=2784310 RepID=UPI0022B14555|nr:N-acetyltransferase 9-like protein isoform X2 [Crassostrea angulata]
MKINSNTIIIGDKVVLVPYEEKHIPRYHDWMKSEDLQRLTASEPLSLEEEYEMQKNWRNDDDKCTFIVINKEKYNGPDTEIDAMVGDVNLFFGEESEGAGEINMMIAGCEHLNLQQVRAKIGFDNEASIKMFTKHGFKEESKSDIFKEVTLVLHLESDVLTKITELTEGYREEKYK